MTCSRSWTGQKWDWRSRSLPFCQVPWRSRLHSACPGRPSRATQVRASCAHSFQKAHIRTHTSVSDAVSRVYPHTQRLKGSTQAPGEWGTAPFLPPEETRVDIPVSGSSYGPLHGPCSHPADHAVWVAGLKFYKNKTKVPKFLISRCHGPE